MKKTVEKIYMLIIFFLIYAPILVLIIFSFNESKSRVTFEGFSFKWYARLFEDVQILSAVYNTVIIAVVSSVVATVLGTIAAVGIMSMKKRTKKVVMSLTNIPMLSPEIVIGVSMMLLFGFVYKSTGMLKPGFITLIISHITFCLPYVVLCVLPKLRQLDSNLYEAALDLGCSPIQAFLKVIIPQIVSGILTGLMMAFTLSVDDFVISYFVSGTTQTLPIAIYSMTRKIVSPEINALSTILFVSVFVLLLIINCRKNKENKTFTKNSLKFFGFVFLITVSSNEIFAVSQNTINVYNWGEYISNGTEGTLDVNAEFTRQTGIKVNYTTYQDNESLFAKLASGASDYDVVFPSDYMVSKLIKNDMLSKLDFAKISNYSKIQNEFKSLPYDPKDEYSVPYTWGTIGIFYNKKFVKEDPDQITWDIFWNSEYKNKMLMFDNSRDAFAIAQIKKGYSVNSQNQDEWIESANELKIQKEYVQSYVMDQIFDKMGNEEAVLAPYYDGDAKKLIQKNSDIGFVIPKQGTVRFVDAMCIPKTSQKKEAAQMYIDFMCQEEIVRANMSYIGYLSPCDPVDLQYVDVIPKTQIFSSLSDEISLLIDDLWVQVKTGDDDSWFMLILVLSGFVIMYFGCVFYQRYRKKQ